MKLHRRSILTVLACGGALALASVVTPASVFTDFEDGAIQGPVADLVIGPAGNTATLDGGDIGTRGDIRLYASPGRAWVFDDDRAGRIEFERPLEGLTVFANTIAGLGLLKFRDAEGRPLRFQLVGPRDAPRRIDLSFPRPVRSMEVRSFADTLALDDLTYVAAPFSETRFEADAEQGPVEDLAVGDAVLNGGQVTVRGIRRLYQSPPHAWVFDPGQEGVLTSARGIVQVTFFANAIDGKGRVTFRNRRGRVVRKVRVKPADEARRFDLAFFRPVHRMEIDHGASVLAIDDLSLVTR